MRCINDVALRLRIISRFELAVIGVVVAIVALAILVFEAQSERMAMTLAIRNMRTGLKLAIAEKLMYGDDAGITALAKVNPMEFLGRQDGSGSGAWGDWQFDGQRRELVYRPTMSLAFEGRDELRWRIEGTAGPSGRLVGLRLVEVLPEPLKH